LIAGFFIGTSVLLRLLNPYSDFNIFRVSTGEKLFRDNTGQVCLQYFFPLSPDDAKSASQRKKTGVTDRARPLPPSHPSLDTRKDGYRRGYGAAINLSVNFCKAACGTGRHWPLDPRDHPRESLPFQM
jgi:hypothetical protein